MLGLLRWTLPQLVPPLTGTGERPPGSRYINIVSAADPLWLGALSAPNSIFVHADRPLISENGTSTIVHEMVHVLLADLDTPRDQDWIDEGLAEYLSLRALKDSGTISPLRYETTIGDFRRWGEQAKSLRTTSSSGPVTARAVAVFHDLDAELRKASGGKQTVATLVRDFLQRDEPASLASLRAAAGKVTGKPPRALAACRGARAWTEQAFTDTARDLMDSQRFAGESHGCARRCWPDPDAGRSGASGCRRSSTRPCPGSTAPSAPPPCWPASSCPTPAGWLPTSCCSPLTCLHLGGVVPHAAAALPAGAPAARAPGPAPRGTRFPGRAGDVTLAG